MLDDTAAAIRRMGEPPGHHHAAPCHRAAATAAHHRKRPCRSTIGHIAFTPSRSMISASIPLSRMELPPARVGAARRWKRLMTPRGSSSCLTERLLQPFPQLQRMLVNCFRAACFDRRLPASVLPCPIRPRSSTAIQCCTSAVEGGGQACRHTDDDDVGRLRRSLRAGCQPLLPRNPCRCVARITRRGPSIVARNVIVHSPLARRRGHDRISGDACNEAGARCRMRQPRREETG